MERTTLSVERKEKSGKGAARSLRRNGIIPAILYRGGSSVPVQISGRELSNFISKTAGEQVIVNLQFPDDARQAIVKDFQVDPVNGSLLHVDFQEISATEPIRVMVHVVIKGEAIGVKRDKGALQYSLREIEIECLPDNILGHIDVDVTNLGLGQSIHVSDLNIGKEIRVLTDPDEVIVTVTAIREEVAAPVVPAETVEPEVLKKGKKEEEK